MRHALLMHEPTDDVAVAVADLTADSEVGAVTLEGEHVTTIHVQEDVPLGHKLAIRDLPEGKHVLEYGRAIGRATRHIACGYHVHIHNLRSMRWKR